jgi:PhzF family phenazine biosynthesis protein
MSNILSFITVDVFTQIRFLGNPLAIVGIPQGKQVSTKQMQTIAREFNLSETIFIHEAQKGSDGQTEWRVRIFLVNAEIPFAGHPTIGAACYALGTLANGAGKGRLICNAGPIEIEYAEGVAKASIPHNFHRHVENQVSVEDVYRLHPALEKGGAKVKSIEVASPVKSMNFAMIELEDIDALGLVSPSGIVPNLPTDEGWEGFMGSFLYVITEQPSVGKPVKVRTRMLQDTMEDPATGSASCALSALLAMRLRLGKTTKFEITQAVEMGRQSDIGVVITLKESMDAVEAMELSGSSVKVMEGTVQYD